MVENAIIYSYQSYHRIGEYIIDYLSVSCYLLFYSKGLFANEQLYFLPRGLMMSKWQIPLGTIIEIINGQTQLLKGIGFKYILYAVHHRTIIPNKKENNKLV